MTKEGTIEVGVNPEILTRLAEFDPNLTLENLYTNKALAEQITQLLKAMITSTFVDFMLANQEKLSISRDAYEMLLDCLIKIILSDDPEGTFH